MEANFVAPPIGSLLLFCLSITDQGSTAMADSTLDLALIEFNELQQVAKDARIPGWDDLFRADLVFALREQGQ